MNDRLSLTGKRWVMRDESGPLSSRDGVWESLSTTRNLSELQGPEKLSDPFLFPEMQKAVDRIQQAMKDREIIGIFGDYDADGITGTAQCVRYFRRHGIEPIVHLPHRSREGYGLKESSIRLLADRGVKLLLTVDTGITAHAEIEIAKNLGMDVIVTDHHHGMQCPAAAYATIHPRIPFLTPNPNLCGSGVAFTLIRALENGVWEGVEIDVVLAMIGTIGDIVPLTGENRLLVQRGLKLVLKLPDGPLKTFFSMTDIRTPKASDIAFRIVPRINASGRMADPNTALKALLEGGEYLEQLSALNRERQDLVEELAMTVDAKLQKDVLFLTIADTTIPIGIAGLLASRFTESLGRPSLIAAIHGDHCHASLRSIPQVDLREIFSDTAITQYFSSFGGHAQAAGCTFLHQHFPFIRIALQNWMSAHGHTHDLLKPTLSLDAELHPSLLSLDFIKNLETLEPFGEGNDEPLFLLRNVAISDCRRVGTDGAHLQCRIATTKAIGFRFGEYIESLPSSIDCAVRIGKNTWNGTTSLQLIIEDLRLSS